MTRPGCLCSETVRDSGTLTAVWQTDCEAVSTRAPGSAAAVCPRGWPWESHVDVRHGKPLGSWTGSSRKRASNSVCCASELLCIRSFVHSFTHGFFPSLGQGALSALPAAGVTYFPTTLRARGPPAQPAEEKGKGKGQPCGLWATSHVFSLLQSVTCVSATGRAPASWPSCGATLAVQPPAAWASPPSRREARSSGGLGN